MAGRVRHSGARHSRALVRLRAGRLCGSTKLIHQWGTPIKSSADLWNLVPQCDPHPPLYFALLKLWMQVFGDTPVAMRSLGAALSVATVGCVIAAGWQINARTGLIAGLLFATAPFQIEFAQDARPYALFALGAALFAFGVLRLMRHEAPAHSGARSSRIGGWVGLIGGGIIAVWTNNTAILMLGALGSASLVLAISDPRARRAAGSMLVALFAIGIAWLPYAPVFIEPGPRRCDRVLDPAAGRLAVFQ